MLERITATMIKANITRSLLLTILSVMSFCIKAEINIENSKIEVTSSNWYPYSYYQGGRLKGSAYNITKAVLDRSQLPYTYNIRPFARLYSEGLRKKNYLIVGMGRTPYREQRFKWVAKVAKPQSIYYYAHLNSPVDSSVLQSKSDLTVGVVRHSFTDEFLTEQQSPFQIIRVNSTEQLIKLAVTLRIDIFLMQKTVMTARTQQLGISSAQFKAIELAFKVQEFMVFSHNTSDDIVNKVKRAYEELEQEGKIILQ